MQQYEIPQGYTLFRQDLESVSALLDKEWEQLRGARIFLTGGTGFFGIWLVESLLWANERRNLGIELTLLTRSSRRFLESRGKHLRERVGLRFIDGTLTDFLVSDQTFSHIIHAASETNAEQSQDWAARHIHAALDGTRHLLEMASCHRSEAVLITTSGAVYSPMDTITDDGRCVEVPDGLGDYSSERIVYGQSKRMMEILTSVAALTGGFRALMARCFCFVGPYLPLEGNYAVGNFLRDVLSGRDIVVSGDGTPLRSYLYPSDLVIWLLKILVSGKSGVPYNVGGEKAISIGDLARTVARIADVPDAVQIRGTPKPGERPSAYLPSISRARQQLGVDISVDLENSIARTLAWYRMRAAS